MLFAYNDDGRLEVVADEDEARRSFEATDVETGVIRFFDSRGEPLTPRFPQRSPKKFLGMSISNDPGPFELVPGGDGEETLLDALGPTVVLMKNRWFTDIDAVRAHLSGNA
jgi:hypothetical protein